MGSATWMRAAPAVRRIVATARPLAATAPAKDPRRATCALRTAGPARPFAAMGSALAVPLSYRFGQWLRNHHYRVDFIESFARIHLAVVTGGMWLFALSVFVYHSCQV